MQLYYYYYYYYCIILLFLVRAGALWWTFVESFGKQKFIFYGSWVTSVDGDYNTGKKDPSERLEGRGWLLNIQNKLLFSNLF